MDATRALLDSLMGKDRDAAGDSKRQSFKDEDVCKYYLVGECPHDMFANQEGKVAVNSPIGACKKQHSEAMRERLKSDRDYRRYRRQYLGELQAALRRLVEDSNTKARRTRQKLLAGASCTAETTEAVDGHITAREMLVSEKVQAAEKMAEDGDMDASRDTMREAEDLAHEKYRLARLKEMAEAWVDEVCEVCGSQISWRALEELDARARGRPHPHEMGAWHVGWARVRSALETVDEAIKECDEGQRVGSGGGKPAREAPSTTGLRGGEAVKDRGSRGGEAGDDRSKAMGANEAFEGEASKERRRSRGKSRQRSKVKRGMRSSCSESGQRKAEAEAEEVKATKRRKAKEASSSPEAAKGKGQKAKEAKDSSPEAAKGKRRKAKEADSSPEPRGGQGKRRKAKEADSSPEAAKGKRRKAKEAKDSSPEAAKGKRRKAKEAKDSSPEAAKGKRRKAKEADSSPESAQQKKRSAKRQRRSSSSSSVRSLRKGRVKDTKREGKAQRQVNGDDGPRKKNKKGGKLKKKEDTSSG